MSQLTKGNCTRMAWRVAGEPVFVWTSVLLLLTIAVAVALVPARRALSVDPSVTLRAE